MPNKMKAKLTVVGRLLKAIRTVDRPGTVCTGGVGGLTTMIAKLKRAPKVRREEQRETCRDFAAAIIESWQPKRHGYSWDDTPDETDRSVFPSLLQQMDDPEMVRHFLAKVMPRDGGVRLDKSFPTFCKRHGWPNFEAELTTVISAATATTISRNTALLQILCLKRDKSAERVGLCRRLADRAVASLVKFDDQPTERNFIWKIVFRLQRKCFLMSRRMA